jgi:hypothetical protein
MITNEFSIWFRQQPASRRVFCMPKSEACAGVLGRVNLAWEVQVAYYPCCCCRGQHPLQQAGQIMMEM